MNHSKWISALGAMLLTAVSTTTMAAALDFPQYGFQIDPLEVPAESASGAALILFLPASEGFAPNVNVMIQPYKGTMKEYVDLSHGQFTEMKFTIVSEKMTGDDEWSAEYTGAMQGSDMHFYAKAIRKEGRVYLVTGTAKISQWDAVSDKLKKVVDSFQAK